MADLLLSEKYKAFLRCTAPVEFLEGTTAAGKTTVGLFKFILRCAASPKRLHVLAGLDQGTIEKNIITKELGVLDDFGDLVEYWPGGRGEDRLPHLLLHAPGGDRKIYVMGYADKARWKKALGGQYGCLYIDEINIADIDFVREAAMRCDYLLATLNPDDPGLPIYAEFIDHARPLPRWTQDTPKEITAQLCQTAKPGWVHWFFSFEHNRVICREAAADHQHGAAGHKAVQKQNPGAARACYRADLQPGAAPFDLCGRAARPADPAGAPAALGAAFLRGGHQLQPADRRYFCLCAGRHSL